MANKVKETKEDDKSFIDELINGSLPVLSNLGYTFSRLKELSKPYCTNRDMLGRYLNELSEAPVSENPWCKVIKKKSSNTKVKKVPAQPKTRRQAKPNSRNSENGVSGMDPTNAPARGRESEKPRAQSVTFNEAENSHVEPDDQSGTGQLHNSDEPARGNSAASSDTGAGSKSQVPLVRTTSDSWATRLRKNVVHQMKRVDEDETPPAEKTAPSETVQQTSQSVHESSEKAATTSTPLKEPEPVRQAEPQARTYFEERVHAPQEPQPHVQHAQYQPDPHQQYHAPGPQEVPMYHQAHYFQSRYVPHLGMGAQPIFNTHSFHPGKPVSQQPGLDKQIPMNYMGRDSSPCVAQIDYYDQRIPQTPIGLQQLNPISGVPKSANIDVQDRPQEVPQLYHMSAHQLYLQKLQMQYDQQSVKQSTALFCTSEDADGVQQHSQRISYSKYNVPSYRTDGFNSQLKSMPPGFDSGVYHKLSMHEQMQLRSQNDVVCMDREVQNRFVVGAYKDPVVDGVYGSTLQQPAAAHSNYSNFVRQANPYMARPKQHGVPFYTMANAYAGKPTGPIPDTETNNLKETVTINKYPHDLQHKTAHGQPLDHQIPPGMARPNIMQRPSCKDIEVPFSGASQTDANAKPSAQSDQRKPRRRRYERKPARPSKEIN